MGVEPEGDGHRLIVEASGIDGLILALEQEYIIYPGGVVGF